MNINKLQIMFIKKNSLLLYVFHKKIQKYNAQIIIEFTFCMIIIFLMIYAMFKIVFWSGQDLVYRRQAHDVSLVNTDGVVEDYSDINYGMLKQLNPEFYDSQPMKVIWKP